MKAMKDIQRWYPEDLQDRREDLLREYLQYEILQLLFRSKYGAKFTFLGGSCLRIAYGTQRFSEDLDFDNVGLTQKEFEGTSQIIKKGLELLGFEVALKFAYKGAFHCNVRFPGLLYRYELSPHKEARVLIKLDTEKQHYEYEREIYRLNKFGVNADIRITPIALLTSQKLAAAVGRKRAKGRDFYDLAFLLNLTKPEYGYLDKAFGVSTPEDLRGFLKEKMGSLDFEFLAKDVSPFLFRREDIETVRHFPDFWETVPL